ncbi:MAG: DNA replication/repair protein RecF [Gammaproteobacteria bacterium]
MFWIKSIELENFRLFSNKKIDLDFCLTHLIGENGSGKSSILEAIYVLAHQRSFRTGKSLDKLIKNKEDFFKIKILIEKNKNEYLLECVKKNKNSVSWFLNKNRVHFREIIDLFSVSLFHIGTMDFFNSTQERRRFLDFMACKTHPGFLDFWSREQKILQQRNALLGLEKSKKNSCFQSQILVFDFQLIEISEKTNRIRKEVFLGWLEFLKKEQGIQRYFDQGLEVEFFQGWSSDLELEEVLKKSLRKDLVLGYTRYGPHRFDIRLSLDEKPPSDFCSRGELKMLLLDVFFSRICFLSSSNQDSICLLDDLVSELDMNNTSKIIERIQKQVKSQVILTTPLNINCFSEKQKKDVFL